MQQTKLITKQGQNSFQSVIQGIIFLENVVSIATWTTFLYGIRSAFKVDSVMRKEF